MRKTFIIATLGFVLDGGAVFFYLNHNAKSNTYATNARNASRNIWRGF